MAFQYVICTLADILSRPILSKMHIIEFTVDTRVHLLRVRYSFDAIFIHICAHIPYGIYIYIYIYIYQLAVSCVLRILREYNMCHRLHLECACMRLNILG